MNAYNKKQGKQRSNRNEKEVPKRGVANNIKGKKVGSGMLKRDNDSDGTPEGNKEDEEDNKNFKYHEEEAEDNFEVEDKEKYERGRM